MKLSHLLLTVLAAAPALLPAVVNAEAQRPDVLLIVIDDLNTDLGYLGAPVQTPNIDALAARGVAFTNAHTNAPVCNPSRTSFLLDQLPPDTGVLDNNTHFRNTAQSRDAVTLPQHFQESGYRSLGSGKIFHSGWRPPGNPKAELLDREASWTDYAENGLGVPDPPKVPNNWHQGSVKTWWGKSFWWSVVDVEDEDTDDWKNADWIARKLEDAGEDDPLFLACGIFRPHLPLSAPQKYFDLYEPTDPPELPGYLPGDPKDLPETGKEWTRKTGVHGSLVKRGLWDEAVQAYRASTSFADACVGRLLEGLDASPERDNTYVVLISDHGFQLGEKTAWCKFSFWNRVSNVPMIVAGPGIDPGVSDATVSLIDLYPTLVDLAGLDAPAGEPLDGRSLRPLLENPDAAWEHPALVFFQEELHEAVIDRTRRYIRYADGGEEFYDRIDDPHDFVNLAADADAATEAEMDAYRKQRRTHGGS